MYVVTVRFAIKPEFADAFLRAVQSNARTSLEREPGCHRFDVATGDAVHSDVFLYEVYTDRAAFETHLASAHFQAFDAEAADWVAAKDVACFHLRDD
jgi:quinol monooxygenase YgiN